MGCEEVVFLSLLSMESVFGCKLWWSLEGEWAAVIVDADADAVVPIVNNVLFCGCWN